MTKKNNFESLKLFNTITFFYGLTDKKLINLRTKYKNFLAIFILNITSYTINMIKFIDIFYKPTYRAIFNLLETHYLYATDIIFLIYNARNSDRLYKILNEINQIDKKFQMNLSSKSIFYKLNFVWFVRFCSILFFTIAIVRDAENLINFAYDLVSVIAATMHALCVFNTSQLVKIQIFLYATVLNKRLLLLHEGKYFSI